MSDKAFKCENQHKITVLNAFLMMGLWEFFVVWVFVN